MIVAGSLIVRGALTAAKLVAVSFLGHAAPAARRRHDDATMTHDTTTPTSTADLPSRARVVVIGGGIIGCSVAYHLALAGCTDVVLLERDQLTSGTTWHAAGLMVTFGSLSETSTEMRKYTADLYTRLEAETGQSTGFKQCGFIELATEPDRLEEYRRVSAFNRWCGIDVHEISAREVGELFPLAETGDVLAGFYVREDGRANPVDVTMALAKGARQRGVRIVQGVAVTDVLRADGPAGPRVTGVRTARGDIEADIVVNCAGMWARQLGDAIGVNIPLQAAEHYYLVTEQIAGVSGDWPVIEDPRNYGYYREEGGGLMIGLFEARCVRRQGRCGEVGRGRHVRPHPGSPGLTGPGHRLRPDARPRLLPRHRAHRRRHPRRRVVPATPTGLGPHGSVRRARDEPRPDHVGDGDPHVLLRPGELHARPRPDRR